MRTMPIRAVTVVALAVGVLLAGCAPTASTTAGPGVPSVERTTAVSATGDVVGTGGVLIPIQSDNVSAAGYDATTELMTVMFDNGRLYEYTGVPAELWEAFVAAQPHPWSRVGKPQLVDGGYPYREITN